MIVTQDIPTPSNQKTKADQRLDWCIDISVAHERIKDKLLKIDNLCKDAQKTDIYSDKDRLIFLVECIMDIKVILKNDD